MSETLTRGVRIIARPRFVPEQSDPDRQQWLFAYHITIRNEGEHTVQLLSRHWVITNGEGKVEEVRGAGVVGYQPVLKPGEEFQYTSGCPLATPVGTMHGEFNMVLADSGEKFDARIDPFRLAVPRALN
jgi:ApaG protein